jgi:hypothetical protein
MALGIARMAAVLLVGLVMFERVGAAKADKLVHSFILPLKKNLFNN